MKLEIFLPQKISKGFFVLETKAIRLNKITQMIKITPTLLKIVRPCLISRVTEY
jgi:hypothetical protein